MSGSNRGSDEPGDDALVGLAQPDVQEELGAKRLLAALRRGLGVSPPQAPRADFIGRYELTDVLGRGGAGVVYRAHDRQLDRDVALKVLSPAPRASDETVSGGLSSPPRLLREARALANIEHPNVVRIFDTGTHVDDRGREHVYLVMELVRGESLSEWFRRRQPAGEVIRACIEAARGLAAAHARGIIHRDFKPHNAIVDPQGVVRVLDFGLARTEAPQDPSVRTGPLAAMHGELSAVASGPVVVTSDRDALTRRDRVLGTPPYMSPEQQRGMQVDASADQYALCVTLYEGLVGHRPFRHEDLQAMYEAKRALRFASGDLESLPPAIRAVVLRGLAPEPHDRFPDMNALVDALVAATRRPPRWRLAALAAGALATVGALVLAGRPSDDPCAAGSGPRVVWSEADERRLLEAYAGTDVAVATTIGEDAAKRLSDHARAIAATWQSVCTSEAGVAHRDSARRCLDDRSDDLAEVVDELMHADGPTVVRSRRVIAGLADPGSCASVGDARHDVGERDPELRAELRRQRRAVADSRVDLDVLRDLVARAVDARDHHVEARARMFVGLSEIEGGDRPVGRAELERVGLLAEATGDVTMASEAWYYLAHEHGMDGSTEDALVALRHGDAAASALAGDASTERDGWAARWAIANGRGDHEEALYAAEQAMAAGERRWGHSDARNGEAVTRLAVALRKTGRSDEAVALLEVEVERAAAQLGADHDSLIPMRGTLAQAYRDVGQRLAALDELFAVVSLLDVRREWTSNRRVKVDTELAALLHLEGESATAIEVGEARLLALRDAAAPAENAHAILAMQVGNVARMYGDVALAITRNREAVALLQRLDDRNRRVPEAQASLARALLAGGRPAEALDVAGEALAGAERLVLAEAERTEYRELVDEIRQRVEQSIATTGDGRRRALERALASASTP